MKKYIVHLFLCISFFATLSSCSKDDDKFEVKEVKEGEKKENKPEVTVPDDIAHLISDMGVGINLGNSLDTHNRDKTIWGNVLPSKAMVTEMANRGFKTFRLPVTWMFHMGKAPEYKIEKEYLDWVEDIVNWALDNDMYVILNIHHDDDWIIPTDAMSDQVTDQISKLWTQVATRFKEYDHRLIFETINEPREKGSNKEWSGGTAENRKNVNRFNQASVDAIRATKGKNTDRYLMVPTHAASATQVALDDFIVPNDDPRIIASVHLYSPWSFCLQDLESGGRSTWGSDKDYEELTAEFAKIEETLVKKGIGVVIGEWCTNLRENNTEDRLRHAEHYVSEATKRGMATVLWDTDNGHGVFDRKNVTWRDYHNSFIDQLFEAYEENK